MKTTHVVIFDVKKVFDKVCHVLLMEKLKLIPKIHSILVNWIQKFLTHRNQKVVIERNFFLRVGSDLRSSTRLSSRCNTIFNIH